MFCSQLYMIKKKASVQKMTISATLNNSIVKILHRNSQYFTSIFIGLGMFLIAREECTNERYSFNRVSIQKKKSN